MQYGENIITLEELQKVLESGREVMVIINGEYYELKEGEKSE